MIRRRWIKAGWPYNMRELARRIQSRNFSDSSSKGFILDRVRDDAVDARFIERIQSVVKTVDPLGRETSFDRVDYVQVPFTAYIGQIGLEIAGPAKDNRKFGNALSELCDFRLTLSNIDVCLAAWGRELTAMTNLDLFTESIQISDMNLSPTTRAKIVVSGSNDVTNDVRDLIGSRIHKIEKVKYQTMVSPKTAITLVNNGAIIISGAERIELIKDARRALLSATTGISSENR